MVDFSNFTPCPKPIKKEKVAYKGIKKKPYKPSGEGKMFLTIWSERPHYCSNQNCKKWLGHEPLAHFFAHIKGKKAHNELRFNKNNIVILCMACHQIFDFGDRSKIILPE